MSLNLHVFTDNLQTVQYLQVLISLFFSPDRCTKSAADNATLNAQLEEAEHKLGLATKNLKTMEANFNDAKSSADSESKVSPQFLIMFYLTFT